MKKEGIDIFASYTTYPSTENIFDIFLLPIESIKDDCIFILDTNALLLPYSTGSQSLTEIKKVFERLKEQKQLIVPGQVAREFANNRPEKLKEIFQQLNRKQSNIQKLTIGKYPLLEEIEDFKKAIEFEKEINEKLDQYRKTINILVDQVKQWVWNDPVSLIYRAIFTKEIILDIPIDKDKIKDELEYRYLHKIPPGFRDDGKADDGIGDLLIWFTILEVAKTKKHVVFVSGDEKNDWYYRSEKQALYPRFELIAEFNRASDGKTFHILKLSELLNLLGANETAVKEVEIEEKINLPSGGGIRNFGTSAERAVALWFLKAGNWDINPGSKMYADYEVLTSDGLKKAVVITLVDGHIAYESLMNGIRFRILGFYADESENKTYSKLQFVFVAKSPGYDFSRLNLNIKAIMSGSVEDRFEVTFGYLNDQGEFIEAQHIWSI